jgi:23S rRNA pseudouridine2605 synthase
VTPAGERLQKILAQAGLGSRRACEELIAEGRVRVNGEVATLGMRADAEADAIEVDGALIGVRQGLVHYLLNKPAGVVTTASDPQGRPTVVDLVPSDPRVYPVGRLDADTEGLLVLTNDGELAHRLIHPSFGVDKEYLADVEGTPSRGAVRRLREGVELDDGPTAPAKVSLVGDHTLRITIHEGRNRQVRRMGDAVGHRVRRLVRVRFGPLSDRRLAPGQWRELTQAEVRSLERAAVATPPSSGGDRRGGGGRRPPTGPAGSARR